MNEARIHTEFEGGETSQILDLFGEHIEAFDDLYGRIPVHTSMNGKKRQVNEAYESERAWINLLGGGNNHHPISPVRHQLVTRLREVQLGRPTDVISVEVMAKKDARTIAALEEYLANPEMHVQNHWTDGLEHDLDHNHQGLPEPIKYYWMASRLGEILESTKDEHPVHKEVLSEKWNQLVIGTAMLKLEESNVTQIFNLFEDQWPHRVANLVDRVDLGAISKKSLSIYSSHLLAGNA